MDRRGAGPERLGRLDPAAARRGPAANGGPRVDLGGLDQRSRVRPVRAVRVRPARYHTGTTGQAGGAVRQDVRDPG